MLLIIAIVVMVSEWLVLELYLRISFVFIPVLSVLTKKAATGAESTTLSDSISMISIACEAMIRFLETFSGLQAVLDVLAACVGKKTRQHYMCAKTLYVVLVVLLPLSEISR
jgi:hypothetical protein